MAGFRPVKTPFRREPVAGRAPDLTQVNLQPEGLLALPWTVDPATSWLDYRCWVECALDAGMALHKPLPQVNPAADTLASCGINDNNLDTLKAEGGGVNLAANSRAQDVIQRMATSTYRFVLRGWGLRVGYQIPIPGLVSVGGVPAVPERVQSAYNMIAGNLAGGVPLWYAAWELHYVIRGLNSPAQAPVPANPALHIRPDAQLPAKGVRLPWTQADQRHLPQAVRPPSGGITTTPAR